MNKIYTDERGSIETIYEDNTSSFLKITSVKGASRANHYHKTSSHYCLLTEGRVKYYERPVGSEGKLTVQTFGPWEVFWTGPMMEHLMVFTEDSVMLCHSTGSRLQANYENDLVRLEYRLDEIENAWVRSGIPENRCKNE